jgi:hypothetical protein
LETDWILTVSRLFFNKSAGTVCGDRHGHPSNKKMFFQALEQPGMNRVVSHPNHKKIVLSAKDPRIRATLNHCGQGRVFLNFSSPIRHGGFPSGVAAFISTDAVVTISASFLNTTIFLGNAQ